MERRAAFSTSSAAARLRVAVRGLFSQATERRRCSPSPTASRQPLTIVTGHAGVRLHYAPHTAAAVERMKKNVWIHAKRDPCLLRAAFTTRTFNCLRARALLFWWYTPPQSCRSARTPEAASLLKFVISRCKQVRVAAQRVRL